MFFACPYRVDACVFISCLFPIVVLQRLCSICLLLIYFVVGFVARLDALHTILFSHECFDPSKLLLALRSYVELVPVMLRFRSSISFQTNLFFILGASFNVFIYIGGNGISSFSNK